MMTLTEFLLARISEDEGLARSSPDRWGANHRAAREAEAKRRIVALHPLDPITVHSWGTTGGGCNLCDHSCNTGGDTWSNSPCDTLRSLALVYAEHPNYREEWRPETAAERLLAELDDTPPSTPGS